MIINSMFISIYRYMRALWFDPISWYRWVKNLWRYLHSYIKFKKKTQNQEFSILLNYPCLHDKYDHAGTASGHYYHQDLLIAQKLFKHNPWRHIDIWSRIDGFIAHVASFRKIEVLDIRNLQSDNQNIIFTQYDLMWDMPSQYIECTDSLSCLHTIEHFGLWRYWDDLDENWHLKWFNQITKMLKIGWVFYFSTPISKNQRIEWNAHRVFSLSYLIEKMFKQKFKVLSFSYVDDQWNLHQDVALDQKNIKSGFWLHYGCGIFELKKI